MNQFNVSGNLTRDPEVHYSPDGKMVTRFAIAIQDRREKETAFLNCVAFGVEQGKDGLAGFVAQYLKKGSRVFASGRLRPNNWTKEGVEHKEWQLIANEIEFGDSKKDAPSE